MPKPTTAWANGVLPKQGRLAEAVGRFQQAIALRPDYAAAVKNLAVTLGHQLQLTEARQAFFAQPQPPLVGSRRSIAAGVVLGCGLVLFLLGALNRAMAGVTQPGSIALATGFAGVLLGIVYFNTPGGRLDKTIAPGIRGALQADARLQAVALFLFPALVWVLSAPLASAIENAVSLFLLRKVVAIVFAVFDFLGCNLVQEGNVLVLPRGQVGVAEACSGIRSLTGSLFAGSFLAAVFLDRFWKKVVLVGAALGLAFLMNLLRSLFLTACAYAYGTDAIEGGLHDLTGFGVLGLTCAGLVGLLPFFRPANWRRWLGWDVPPSASGDGDHGGSGRDQAGRLRKTM